MTYDDVHTIMRAKRIARGLTQQQLADRVRVSRKTIVRFETGASRPHNSVLLRLAAELDVDPQDIA